MTEPKQLRSTLITPLQIPILQNEYWYGGTVMDGSQYPFTVNSNYQRDLIHLETVNQATPALISTKGRAIWSDQPFSIKEIDGNINICSRGWVNLDDSGSTLRDAQKTLAQHTFSFGNIPPEEFFILPQWNDWIELLYNQNQVEILKYAHDIVDHGFPAGILMIDDLWADYYGNWKFSKNKFQDAVGMVAELHNLGFKVMVWVCPFITPDTKEYHYLRDRHLLICDETGKPAIREWWNGYSALIDLSNPEGFAWLKSQLQNLQRETHVDGFKFDAGDPQFYNDDDETYMELTHQEQTELWAEFGKNFAFNEFRSNYRNQGEPIVNRLQDKAFSWGKDGLAELIPDTLTQGMVGYYFNCPDMIGGGEYRSFLSQETLDQELIVRSAQCCALMPMMQFSVAPWRVLDKTHLDFCLSAAELHEKMGSTMLKLAKNAAITGEPITRSMAYEFPDADVNYLHSQFMLGSDILVAPVIEKGATTKSIYFPTGEWESLYDSQETVTGPTAKSVPVALSSLPVYKKIN